METTKTVLIPDDHYQRIMSAYIDQMRLLNQPYSNVITTLPTKSDQDGYITFQITYEDFL